jgi:hypothetical protein
MKGTEMQTKITIGVRTDPDYKYEVNVDKEEEISISYIDFLQTTTIHFANLDEMEEVAKAMLKAAKFSREE